MKNEKLVIEIKAKKGMDKKLLRNTKYINNNDKQTAKDSSPKDVNKNKNIGEATNKTIAIYS